MGAISYFPGFHSDDGIANISGSSCGEPDGKTHRVEVLEGEGHLIVRVELDGGKGEAELLFNAEQANAFGAAVQTVLSRLGLDE